MKLLAIESSSLVASVALLADDTVLAEYSIDYKKTHSQTLLPMIDEIVKMTDTTLDTIDAVAVSGGPGSFTGLRIGASIAKGLCLAVDKPVISVPTLDAMAYNFTTFDGYICPIMDARRNQVYTGIYSFEEGNLVKHLSSSAMDIDSLIDYIKDKCTDRRIIFLGDGLPAFGDTIRGRLADKAEFAPANLSRQRASSVAMLGAIMLKEGRTMNSDEFSPDYLRQSQAEREYTQIVFIHDASDLADADTNRVLDFEKEYFSTPWDKTSIESHLKNSCNGLILAKRNDAVVGYLLYQKVCGDGEIFKIAVDESYRRAGIAKHMIMSLEDDADTDLWSLEVRASNTPAIKLYESAGYEATRVRQDYYSEPLEDAVIMEHRIRESK